MKTRVQPHALVFKSGILHANLTVVAGLGTLPLLVVVALGTRMSAGRPGANGPATCQTASPADRPRPTQGD